MRVMTLKHDTPRWIGDVIDSNRRMMGDLLDNKRRQPTCVGVWPITVEKSARRKAELSRSQDLKSGPDDVLAKHIPVQYKCVAID